MVILAMFTLNFVHPGVFLVPDSSAQGDAVPMSNWRNILSREAGRVA